MEEPSTRPCPICGAPDRWAPGLVFHRDCIHVRLCLGSEPGSLREGLASIVQRTYHGPRFWEAEPEYRGLTVRQIL